MKTRIILKPIIFIIMLMLSVVQIFGTFLAGLTHMVCLLVSGLCFLGAVVFGLMHLVSATTFFTTIMIGALVAVLPTAVTFLLAVMIFAKERLQYMLLG